MAYSVNLLTIVPECDKLLGDYSKQRDDLLFRQLSLQRQQTSYSGSASEVQAELTGINGQVASLQTMVAGLAPGDDRDVNEARLKRLELRQFLLGQRQNDYSPTAVIDREHDLARVAADIAEVETLIAAVETRKAQL